jgi:dCMP deaminase
MFDTQILLYAYRSALHSPDPSTQNGAVLVNAVRWPILETLSRNEFPFGLAYEDERWLRPSDGGKKYDWIEHAERNAIYKAAELGIKTRGLTLACPWAACADCARGIVQAGIEILIRVSSSEATNGRWHGSVDSGDIILREGGVRIDEVPVAEFAEAIAKAGLKPLRRDGQPWPA